MSLDLRRDLHAYGDFMEETQGSLTVEQILKRSGVIQLIPDDERDPHRYLVNRRWAAVAAVAAVLLTVGVALLIGALRTEVPPADSTIPVPTTSPVSTPSSVPETADQGTLDTPMGTFDWWQLTGVDPEVPPPGWLVKGPSGYSLIHGPWGDGLEYWRSADGKTWTPAPSPGFEGDAAWLEKIAGDYWLSTDAPSLWRSEDGESWVEVPLPAGYSQTPYQALHEVSDEVWLTSTDPLGVWLLDGTGWTSLDLAAIAPGEVTELDEWTGVEIGPTVDGERTVVATEGDLVIAEVHEPLEGLSEVWISEDGTNWSPTGITGHSLELIRLDSGAIYMGDFPSSEMFFSVDLRNWEKVDVSAVSAYAGSGGGASMTSSAGNTVSFMVSDERTARNAMWILELQE